MYLTKRYFIISIGILFLLTNCANTGKINFENNINYDVLTGKPTIEKLVEINKKRGDYLGITQIKINTISRKRYHFKFKGNPKMEPCYYYYEVDYKTKKLLGWGYDDKGDDRACVN